MRSPSTSRLLRPLALLCGLGLAACGAAGGGAGGPVVPTTGTLTVRMHDHKVESAEHVYVTIESVEVFKIVDGEEVHETVTSVPGQYDLLALQNGVEAVIGGASFEPGDYKSIRLIVARDTKHDIKHKPAAELKNYIVVEGKAHPLVVPSGAKTGIKLGKNFSIVAGETTTLTLDFDLRLSVHRCGHKKNHVYRLKPRIRVVKVTAPGAEEPAPTPPSETPPGETPPGETPPADGISGIAGTVTLGGFGSPANALVSAQQNGSEVASADLVTDPETGVISYAFTTLADGTYDLVVIAEGFAFASETGVVLTGGTTSAAHDFSASPIEEGGLGVVDGTVSVSATSADNVTVTLVWNGFTVDTVAADPTTGYYIFLNVPPGDYTVVATDDVNTTSGTVSLPGGTGPSLSLP
jgi:hypothetical protein